MAAIDTTENDGPARDESGGSSLGDRVYRTLRDEIVFLDLPPGAPVREVDVAKRLGVGRTPVREALQRLAMNYLVELLPGRGAFVAPIWFSIACTAKSTRSRPTGGPSRCG